MRPPLRDSRVDSTAASPAAPRLRPACFGVLCPKHGDCARYAAVDDSFADVDTIVTCRRGDHLPLFIARVPRAALMP